MKRVRVINSTIFMRSKYPHLWGVISLTLVILSTHSLYANVFNGGFEISDFNTSIDINIPTGWQCENYTSVVGKFIPNPESGATTHWRINTIAGLPPFEGEHFLVLSTGNMPRQAAVGSARVWQDIAVEAGDMLTGVYFYGTCDYISSFPNFNDWADIQLIHSTDPNKNVPAVHVTTKDVGSYGSNENSSMSGWKKFAYFFDANHTGNYTLVIDVNDFSDLAYESYIAVDALALCHNSLYGDLNCDCTVDFQDFSLLAADWLCNCKNPLVHSDSSSDPNLYNDPNLNCLLGTNLSGNNIVDGNSLLILTEYWLEGTRKEQ